MSSHKKHVLGVRVEALEILQTKNDIYIFILELILQKETGSSVISSTIVVDTDI